MIIVDNDPQTNVDIGLKVLKNMFGCFSLIKGSDRQSEVVELSMQYCAQIL